MGQAARVHDDAEMHARGGRRGLARASHGELELTAMVDAHGSNVRSRTVATVAVY